MTPKKTLFISDLHMTDAASFSAKPHPYGKLTPLQAARVVQFCNWVYEHRTEFGELVLLGDIIDLWTCPCDATPPTVKSVLAAKHNKAIVTALQRLIDNKVLVTYIPGNHDITVNKPFLSGMVLASKWTWPDTDVALGRHGHEDCLFNGKDPKGRLPLGYYVCRAAATRTCQTGASFPSPASMLIKHRDDMLQIPRVGLVTTVWNVVAEEAKLTDSEPIDMVPDRSPTVAGIRTDYATLYRDRKGNADQLLTEFDPYYGAFGTEKLFVCGHSHEHRFAQMMENKLLYLNTGAWCCDDQTYFAAVWPEAKRMYGSLWHWDTAAHEVNTGSVAL